MEPEPGGTGTGWNRNGTGPTRTVAITSDDSSDKEYYGVLRDIFEVHYPGGNHVFVFKCIWFDVENHERGYKVDEHGLISVNKNRHLKSDDVYVLESQAAQVFYIEDARNENWEFVVKAQPRDLYNMRSKDPDKQAIDVDAYQQVELEYDVEGEAHDSSHDDFSITSSPATNMFVEHKGSKEVQMVKNIIDDEGFINDGEIKIFGESSEIEEEFDIDTSP
ncbi:unnamed protein product [Amaranthus hypochondriacus]